VLRRSRKFELFFLFLNIILLFCVHAYIIPIYDIPGLCYACVSYELVVFEGLVVLQFLHQNLENSRKTYHGFKYPGNYFLTIIKKGTRTNLRALQIIVVCFLSIKNLCKYIKTILVVPHSYIIRKTCKINTSNNIIIIILIIIEIKLPIILLFLSLILSSEYIPNTLVYKNEYELFDDLPF